MPTAAPERPAGLPGRRPGADRTGRSLALPKGTGRAAARIAALTVCQAALLIGFGLLITGPARHVWPMTAEDEVNEALEQPARAPSTRCLLGVRGGQHPHGRRGHAAWPARLLLLAPPAAVA